MLRRRSRAGTFPGYLDGWVDDLDYIDDPDDGAAMRGFDLSTNADWVSSPLQLDYETNSIVLDASNSHFENDGTTVFVGEAEFRIPFAMLSRLYNVDDPASLTASAFTRDRARARRRAPRSRSDASDVRSSSTGSRSPSAGSASTAT